MDWATEKADGKPLTAAAIRKADEEVMEAEPDDDAAAGPDDGGRQHDDDAGHEKEPATAPEPGKFRGVGVLRANEAIDALKRIPKNDALRKRGFQIVSDWIKANRGDQEGRG